MHHHWDWYQGTLHTDGLAPQAVADRVCAAYDMADITPARGLNGYEAAAAIKRGDRELARVMWGGNPGIHVKATGENAPALAGLCMVEGWRMRITRVDARCDWVAQGLFDDLAREAIKFARAKGIKLNQQGDWARGEARTLYLGAVSSPVRLVLYEKGYEAGGDPNWVRMEVRVRPKGQDQGYEVGTWQPAQCFTAATWLTDLMDVICMDTLAPKSVGTVWRPSDTQRARLAMLKQYGKVLERWVQEAESLEAFWEQVQQVRGTGVDVFRQWEQSDERYRSREAAGSVGGGAEVSATGGQGGDAVVE